MKYKTPGDRDFIDFDNPVSDRKLDKRDLEKKQEKFYDNLITIIIRERLYRERKGTVENNTNPHK